VDAVSLQDRGIASVVKKQDLMTPDWILSRPGRTLVPFECKARRPTLQLQRRASRADIESEVKAGVSRALKQAVVFLDHADAGRPDLAAFKGLPKVIYPLVLYEPFHYHAVPDIRQLIDSTAESLNAEWPKYRDRILFVPLGIRELESAVALERERGIPVERQLEGYTLDRRSAPGMTVTGGGVDVAKHFEEFALGRWNGSVRCQNPLCMELWEKFLDFIYHRLYQEPLRSYEQAMRRHWIEEAAYFRWVNEGRSHGRDLLHWTAAERGYDELEKQLGMPPYEARMARDDELQRRFSSAGP
jgi:hypothetical protein